MCTYLQYAQTISSSISKKKILIGEQFTYNLSVTAAKKEMVHFNAIPDSLEGFEVIDRAKIDTVKQLDNVQYSQAITFTSFDSGRWVLPAFEIAAQLYTDTFEVQVGYAPADSTNALRDIKPIIFPEEKKIKWYYFVIAGLLLLMLIYFIIRSILNNRKHPPIEATTKISAYNEAMAALQQLQSNSLSNAVDIKEYHTKLAAIFHTYCNRSLFNVGVASTTSDLLVNLSKQKVDNNSLSTIAAAMRCNDAVKFAKFIPDNLQSKECLTQLKDSIQYLENNTNK